MDKVKYYAIKDDTHQEIVNSWDEAKLIIADCKNAKYKAFLSKEEAEAFLKGIELSDGISEPKCYIDGSFNNKTNAYGFGAILIIDNKEYVFKKGYNEMDEYTDLRNVAGEIKGAGFIINYAIKNNIKKLHIFYDYEGIEAWYTGRWKANSNIAIKYKEFADFARNSIDVIFHKVKSHTNNKYNDLVDKLAKEAVQS